MKYLIAISIFVGVLLLSTCQNSESSSSSTSSTVTVEDSNDIYLKKGKQIASTTFGTLSGQLQKAMKEGGVSNAVKYCNLAAHPLVDSLSKVHNANIRRTSLQVRSPKNKPTPLELQQLQAYEKQVKAGENLKPKVKEIDAHTVAFYAPIHMMPLCEKCHGEVGKALLEKDYQVIQQFYPKDKAIGYVSGDWRGMWSISFKKIGS